MDVIFLRHGPTAGNLLHQYIGVTDQPLSPEGEALVRRWRGLLPVPELLFVSPLRRCRQTAALIWPETDQLVVPELRETDFGGFEGKTWAELRDDPRYRAWIDGTAEPPGGESREQVSQRVAKGWQSCREEIRRQKPSLCAVVAHGGTLMEILSHELGGGFYDWQTNCGEGWRLREDGEAERLRLPTGV